MVKYEDVFTIFERKQKLDINLCSLYTFFIKKIKNRKKNEKNTFFFVVFSACFKQDLKKTFFYRSLIVYDLHKQPIRFFQNRVHIGYICNEYNRSNSEKNVSVQYTKVTVSLSRNILRIYVYVLYFTFNLHILPIMFFLYRIDISYLCNV